ncbi:MAG: hypothetical protein ACREMP_00145 [Candidatus Tyrphobacter sp.]
MKRTLVTLAAAIAAFTIPAIAFANCGDTFAVVNQGSHTVYSINVSPHSNSNWGPDLLGDYTLSPGNHVQPLSFYYGANPYYPSADQDVRVTYTDGYVWTDDGVDICSQYVVLNY